MSNNESQKMLSIRQQIWVGQMIHKWYVKWKTSVDSDVLKKQVALAVNDLKNTLCEINDYQFNTVEALLKIDQECQQLENRITAPE